MKDHSRWKLPAWIGGLYLASVPLGLQAQEMTYWDQVSAPYTKQAKRARAEQERAIGSIEVKPVSEKSRRSTSLEEVINRKDLTPVVQEGEPMSPPDIDLPDEQPVPLPTPIEEPKEQLMFEGYGQSASCWTDCNSCCYPAVPTMLGDGGLLQPRLLQVGGNSYAMQNHMSKVAENNPVLPTTRASFQYNALQQVPIGINSNGSIVDEDLHEFRIGYEQAFFDRRFSAEVLVPFYATSEYRIEGTEEALGPQTSGQMGDLAFGFKGLLHRGNRHAISTGLRVEAPTQEDILVQSLPAEISDDVWHFTPYIAAQWQPTDLTFTQAFVSYRFNDRAMVSSTPTGDVLFDEPEYLMVDASIGHWIIRNPDARILTGLAPVLEMHYTTATTREPSLLEVGRPATGAVLGSTDYLNLTAAVVTEWYGRATLTTGFAFPLRRTESTLNSVYPGDTDRNYNWAFMVNLNVPLGRR